MTRRDLIALLGGTAVSWPVGVRAQQLQRMRRIGVLSAGPVEPTSPSMTVLPNALRQLGWTEGKCGSWDGPKGKTSRSNVGTRTIELSACLNSQRNSSSLTSMSFSEFGSLAPLAAKQATTTIPIVMGATGDHGLHSSGPLLLTSPA